MSQTDRQGTLRLAAVGDLLLAHDAARPITLRQAQQRLEGFRAFASSCDLVLGNLECTLPGDGKTVATQPRVVSSTEWIEAVASCGFNVLCMANNHAFDCLDAGFRRLRRTLEGMGIACFGGGDDLSEARRPAILNANGLNLGFLGAMDAQSGPCQLAGAEAAGVWPLNVEEMAGRISELRSQVDHVIVSVHWGQERLNIPSPAQIAQAHAMVDAGASVVLAHHPHVLQGVEVYHGAAIAYSLGNFVACDVPYDDGDRLSWNVRERTGCVLVLEFTRSSCRIVEQVATIDDGTRVGIDPAGPGHKRIEKVNRLLARGVGPGQYRREYFRVKVIEPTLAHLRWSQLRKLRWGNFRRAFSSLLRAIRAR